MTTEEFTGLALEARIRVLVTNRSWYRAHRTDYPWRDLEADNADELRLLLRVRSAGRRVERLVQANNAAARHAYDAVEAARWAQSVAAGQYLPDVPMADAGDHHFYPEGVGL